MSHNPQTWTPEFALGARSLWRNPSAEHRFGGNFIDRTYAVEGGLPSQGWKAHCTCGWSCSLQSEYGEADRLFNEHYKGTVTLGDMVRLRWDCGRGSLSLSSLTDHGMKWDSFVPIVAVKAAAGEYDYTVVLPDGYKLGINYIDIDIPRKHEADHHSSPAVRLV